MSKFIFAIWLLLGAWFAASLRAGEASMDFDGANRLYEQGRFAEAAAAYGSLTRHSPPSATLYFNLGNAWFKAEQTGRAIAAWRQAARIVPRDPDIRFNLEFARKKVSGSEISAGTLWERTLAALTLNEWSVIGAVALWLWFGLLALRELRPNLRRALDGYTATAGASALVLAACVGAAAMLQNKTRAAVVTVPEAIARSGPLEEAKVLHHFRDGTELTLLDQKELAVEGQNQSWLQVRDRAKHIGWIKSDQVVLMH